jgi:hypothetical protein
MNYNNQPSDVAPPPPAATAAAASSSSSASAGAGSSGGAGASAGPTSGSGVGILGRGRSKVDAELRREWDARTRDREPGAGPDVVGTDNVGGPASSVKIGSGGDGGAGPMSTERERIARAAEERMRKQKELAQQQQQELAQQQTQPVQHASSPAVVPMVESDPAGADEEEIDLLA